MDQHPEQAWKPGVELLRVEDLHISFPSPGGAIQAVSGVDFSVYEGEVLGLVGESGCGKTMTAMAILGLLPYPGRVTCGRILFRGQDLLQKSENEMRAVRGDRIGMIFQQPSTALNPVVRVGRQVGEPLVNHRGFSWHKAVDQAIVLLESMRLPAPRERVRAYPHELSGGMQQRAVIATAMACAPDLVIADEPTTALDVTIQAQILELLREAKRERRSSLLFITHDLGVVAEMCDRVAVMYSGRIVEVSDVASLFRSPQHPYSRALLEATPRIGGSVTLASIDGQPPVVRGRYEGCRFRERCPLVGQDCLVEPDLSERAPGHLVRCWRQMSSAQQLQPPPMQTGQD